MAIHIALLFPALGVSQRVAGGQAPQTQSYIGLHKYDIAHNAALSHHTTDLFV